MAKFRYARSGAAVVIAAMAVTLTQTTTSSAEPTPDTLPAPYSNWDVTLEPNANPQVLTLEFNSPLLDRRVTNTVYVPDSYQDSGQPSSVLYSLHGTVFPQINDPALQPVTQYEALLAVTGAGGGYEQTKLSRFDTQLDRAQFLVVAPDTTLGKPWCETCVWVDGRDDIIPNIGSPVTAETVPADSHLHEELYPLVEELFNVRTDRGGRGVTGFSMGAWAALLQGFKHPDKYGFVAPVSFVYDGLSAPELRVFLDANGYLRDQGYGTSITHEIWWRNFNPASIAGNVSGIDQKLVLTGGDACIGAESAASPDCVAYPALRHPLAALIEVLAAHQFEIARRDLASKGIPAQLVQSPGVHGANNHRMYADYIVPEANKLFARDVASPSTFSYQAVEKTFGVWGYDVTVDRPNDEFLTLSDARTDGTAFTLTGTGTVDVRTPAEFTPGSTHTVNVTPDRGAATTTTVTADAHGRLPIRVGLGATSLLDQSIITELLGVPARTARVTVD